jgi:hypothetical protein
MPTKTVVEKFNQATFQLIGSEAPEQCISVFQNAKDY